MLRVLVVAVTAAACSKGAAGSPRALCEKIHPELVASLTSTGVKDVRTGAKAEFIAACEVLPVRLVEGP